jgi:hypothetical protein
MNHLIMDGRYTVEEIQREAQAPTILRMEIERRFGHHRAGDVDNREWIDDVANRSHEFFESALQYGYGTRDTPEDGEPYWKVSWSSNVYWTSSEPDGSTFQECETAGYEAFYFRDEQSAQEWVKFLEAWDSTMDIDEPRFVVKV